MKNIFLPLLISILSLTAYSQVTVRVKLVDATTGTSLPGINVSIRSAKGTYVDSASSDSSGLIVFSGLKDYGKHFLETSESNSYFEAKNELVVNAPVSNITFFLTQKKFSLLGEVFISTKSGLNLNRKNASQIHTIDRNELKQIPIEGRDVSRALIRIPNMTVATMGYAEGPNVSINGTTGNYTNYLIDGMDNNERFLGNVKFNTPVGFVDALNVYTNNYSVIYGNTSSGIVNVTTRSGKNEYEGEVFYLTRPGKLTDAKSPFATRDLSGNQVKDGFMRHQVGLAFGGPIRKDKTFFYVNAEQTFDKKDNLLDVPTLGINEIVTGRNSFTYVSGKIDHYWKPRFRTTVRANVGWFDIDRQGGGLEGGNVFPSAGSTQANRTYLVAVQNSYEFNKDISGETNYQHSRFRWNYRRPNNPSSPSVTLRDPSNVIIGILGQTGAIFDDIENTDQIQQRFVFKANRHTIRTGVEFITSDFALLGGGNPNGSYDVRLTQTQLDQIRAKNIGSNIQLSDIPAGVTVSNYQVELQTKTFGRRQNVYSIYVEDEWAITKRLTTTLGLRYDYDNLTKGGGNKGDVDNLGPRFGFNYKIDDNSVLRGGYGVFYDKLKYSVISDALQFNSNSADYKRQLQVLINKGILPSYTDVNQVTFNGNLLASVPNVTYLNGPNSEQVQSTRDKTFSQSLRILNPDGYQTPMAHHVTIGYQRKINYKTVFSVDLLHVATRNLYHLYDLNAPSLFPVNSPVGVIPRTVAQANATRPVPINGNFAVVNGDTLRGIARDVLMTKTDGRANYYSAAFVLQKLKDEDNFSYRISYVLSEVKNNTDGINDRALDGNDFEAEYGPGLNDRTHVLSGLFSYFPLKRLAISPAILVQSGQVVTRYIDGNRYVNGIREFNGNTDLNGNGTTFGGPGDRYPGEMRNGDRLPWSTTIDLNVQYQIPLKNGKPIELTMDVFNLLNADNWGGFNATFGTGNQQQLGPSSSRVFQKKAAAPPRQFQFGVRYVF